ncbi:A24 family peptidase [Planctomycetes bacterium K23_9]|uniref:Type IV leader peptidase family protein n=1 Tax=Stieleria marina TaxID=1930275 RepID=A0A517NZ15_9BACT|nr:Type IV leader peptidase family protein [Planctomycetes bacterium K23_9]
MELDATTIAMVILFSTIALVTDLKNRRIPNWLTVSSAIAGLAWHAWSGGLAGVGTSLGGFATGFGLLLLLWAIGGGGGGDVKLMGAVGAWLGAFPTLLVFVGSAGFAIVCTIVLVTLKRMHPAPVGTDQAESQSDAAEGDSKLSSVFNFTVPYALPVAMAVWSLALLNLMK